jgi:hypothetical protein
VTADVPFYVALAREADGLLVELAIGNGRVAIPVAQATEIEEPAAMIYCPGRSLLHLPTWADRRRCFERVAASLRPNGRFAWNAFAFDHQIASAIDGQHADTPLPHTIHYSVSDNRVDITLDDGGTGSLWWATKNEWLGLLDVAGLRLEALYGGSPANRSTTTATSTSSWPAAKRST